MDYLQAAPIPCRLDSPCGLLGAEIASAGQRLNIRFPVALCEYLFALCGSEAVNQSFNWLLLLKEIDFNGAYLVLAEENQVRHRQIRLGARQPARPHRLLCR